MLGLMKVKKHSQVIENIQRLHAQELETLKSKTGPGYLRLPKRQFMVLFGSFRNQEADTELEHWLTLQLRDRLTLKNRRYLSNPKNNNVRTVELSFEEI